MSWEVFDLGLLSEYTLQKMRYIIILESEVVRVQVLKFGVL